MPQNLRSNSSTRPRPLSRQSHFVALLSLSTLLALFLGKVYPLAFQIDIPKLIISLIIFSSFLMYIGKPKTGRLFILLLTISLLYINSSNFQYSLKVYDNLFGKTVSLVGQVQDDAAYNQYGDYEFNITNLNFIEDGEYLPGRVRVRTKQNAAVYRGDKIFVEGKLKPALGSRTGSISYASVEVINSGPSALEQYRLKFFSSVYSSLPEPHASLGIGFLAGVRSSISKDFQDQLSRVGLTHIIAVSGYNLTILVLAIGKLGRRLSKYQKTLLSLTLIMIFLLITGFSPSVVRAAVVCFISISCSFFGRKMSPINLILVSAAITSGFNPTYLLEDIGWWLSFLAFFGVLVVAPTLTGLFYKEKEAGVIPSIIIESLCAQITTAPLIAYIFGTFSAISLLANVLVVSWIPVVMLFVLVTGLTGIFNPDIARHLALLPKIILTPIVLAIEKLSALPWASVQLKFSLLGMLASYLFIGLFVRLANNTITRRHNAKL